MFYKHFQLIFSLLPVNRHRLLKLYGRYNNVETILVSLVRSAFLRRSLFHASKHVFLKMKSLSVEVLWLKRKLRELDNQLEYEIIMRK